MNWGPCFQWLSAELEQATGQPIRYECAQVPVPLDHDSPRGARVLLALLRIPASDQANRIGSVFLNPGGPGGSGVDAAAFLGPFAYSDEVRSRFDVVGFDPRGIGRSTQLRCVGSPRQLDPWFISTAWPETADEVAATADADAAMQDDCDQRGGRILDNMSTADVARDMDLLRRALGDDALNYVGYSYGSYLGATYANLFPENVRALVVDGVLDPQAWATGEAGQQDLPFSTRLGSDVGAQDTLDEFFRLCDEAGPGCPFAAPGGAAARYAALREALTTQPIVFADGFVYDERILVADTLGALYGSPGWWFFAEFLTFIEAVASGVVPLDAPAFESKRRSVGAGRGGFPTYPGFEGFAGVACADTDNPDDVGAWVAAAEDRAEVSLFGPLWTWASSTCSRWPGSQDDRFTGPWTAETANPVLIVSTRYDPATPLHGADRLAALLPNSAQITVEGWGHTSLGLSQAADAAVSHYLLNGTLPTPGTHFVQDIDPFTPPGAPPGPGAELRKRYEEATFGPG